MPRCAWYHGHMTPETQQRLCTLAGIDTARAILESSTAELAPGVTVATEIADLRRIGGMLGRARSAGVPEAIAIRACVRTGQRRTAPALAAEPLRRRAITAVLSGSTGSGKSHAAARLLAVLGGTWVPAVELSDYRSPLWETLHRSSWLAVIDEVDAGHVAARIGQAVCNRHDRGARTIITANDTDGWWAAIDPAGRLRSRCEADGVIWPDEDKRQTRPGRATMRGDLVPIEAVEREARLADAARILWQSGEVSISAQGHAAAVLLAEMRVPEAEVLERLDGAQEDDTLDIEDVRGAVLVRLGL